ncbi:MAG: hypothetical protein KDB79_06060 [Acidobacteria bacterium]|nr:hypothetical protein [Acidobacteriota bacterium]
MGVLKFSTGKTSVFIISIAMSICFSGCNWLTEAEPQPLAYSYTVAGTNKEFGEPFGIAEKDGEIYISDGEKGVIWRVSGDGKPLIFAEKLDTPSQIAFDQNGDLIVADSGSHTIKKVLKDGRVERIAGVENESGYRDGDINSALFNAPIGVVPFEGKIFVADTYNDRIRVIENGRVNTLAGGQKGFADGRSGTDAQFDTPCGLAVWGGKLLVADSQNHRIRVVEMDGATWTLAGNGNAAIKDGELSRSSFIEPLAITTRSSGEIFVAGRGSIRVIGQRLFPIVETITRRRTGFRDGKVKNSIFNRPGGIVSDKKGDLYISDSENQLVRMITSRPDAGKPLSQKAFTDLQMSAREFREQSPGRWPYDPPERTREIAATFGEIRGEMDGTDADVRFHNGLDIVGGYGEEARFIRDEKVLRPTGVQLFDTTRESLSMPTLGYVHIRLGRDVNQVPFGDKRFLFSIGLDGKPTGVRVPRGSKFKAGEVIGTLNTFNHVHLIAGRSGRELNALDALVLPGVSDSRVPTVQKISLFDEKWHEFETEDKNSRIELSGKTRIVVETFDQMDGNADRRKLGIYRLGYQILDNNGDPVQGFEKPLWTISFSSLPDARAVGLVFAKGSRSGATGETIFRYIVTNEVNGFTARENFFKAGKLKPGAYVLKVFAADFFGNIGSKDIEFEKK